MKFVLPILLLFLVSCFNQTEQPQVASQPSQALPVPVVEVTSQALPLSWEYPAQVSGYREVEIRARVAGILLNRGFEPGDSVQKDQSLYRLDPEPYRVALNTVLAELQSAQARLRQASRNLKRIQPLLASQAVSQLEFDQATAEEELAQAQLELAKARVDSARLNVEYAQVKSPVSGFVSRSLFDEGSLVSGPSELLTTVTQVDQVYLNFGIPQADYDMMRSAQFKLPGQASLLVSVVGTTPSELSQQSALKFQDVRVSADTGTVDARSLFKNQEGLYAPGQFVRVKIHGALLPNAILVPQRAVIQNPQGGKIVMTVAPDKTVAPRPVEVGPWQGDQWVIRNGLQAGDLVIVDGFMKLQPGMPVTPVINKGEPATGSATRP